MLVVFPIGSRDHRQAQALLRWIGELEPQMPHHEALLVYPQAVDPQNIRANLELAQKCFGTATAIRQREPGESDHALFQLAFHYIASHQRQPWYWCEPDVVPLCPGWLDQLEREYVECGRPFLGAISPWSGANHRLDHLAACAIYPLDLPRLNPYLLKPGDLPWDCVRPDLTLRYTHASQLMQEEWGDRQTGKAWTFPDRKALERLRPGAVVFHRCPDGTLLARLREQRFPAATPTAAPPRRTLAEKLKRAVVQLVRQRLELPDVTLVCVDTLRPDLAWKGVKACLDQVAFGDVQFFNHTNRFPHSVALPELAGIDGYNRFILQELHRHVKTSHVLICQWDGFILNPQAWSDAFLKWDYLGAPWNLPYTTRRVGNGGFSLRSVKLLQQAAQLPPPYHPEDQLICIRHAEALEARGVRFAPVELASAFSCELGHYQNQFGFHSFQTELPDWVERPVVCHHSGLVGDILYACAAMADLGLSALYISSEVRGPDRGNTAGFRQDNRYAPQDLAEKLAPFLRLQPYIADCRLANKVPDSTDVDFNLFRVNYQANRDSLLRKQCAAAGASWPEKKPWFRVDFPVLIPERPIVVHRSPRYHNAQFPWAQLVARHARQMVMVGDKEEHQRFVHQFGVIPHLPTPDLLSLARVIAGARVFVGNQSAPMALALGLGRPVVQEVFLDDPNCRLARPQALYVTDANAEIPRAWLR